MPRIEIINGKVYVEGKETANPELIGFAVLDLAEKNNSLRGNKSFPVEECRPS